MRKQILFLCSGNYYRSRFAEILFNHLAQENELQWRADSRGIVAQWSHNPGTISQATLEGLRVRNIPFGEMRNPMQLSELDLTQAHRIIALYEREHRWLMQQYFPNWTNEIAYWNVPDLDGMNAEKALALIERNVKKWIEEIQHDERHPFTLSPVHPIIPQRRAPHG